MEVKAVINVAIVEDEQEAVEYLSDCLHRYGEKTGETFSFTHFPEPITFLEKYKPVYDLVFMDIRMPMMDGMQAAKKLREADTSVLLVFVTRMGDYAIQGYDVGATAFIKKPIRRTSPSWRRSSMASTSAGTAKPTSRSSSWRRASCRRGRKSTSAATISAWSSAQEPTTRKCRSKRCKAGWDTPMLT